MTDHAEPLIALGIAHKEYADAMRNKRYEAARMAAMQLVRLAVDLLEIAEKK